MVFIISLAIAILIAYFGHEIVKKHCTLFYALSTVIALTVIYFKFTDKTALFDPWFKDWVWPIFARGALATSFFILVMYAVILPSGSKLMKNCMYIRGELSIIAAILTLGHNIAYGKKYFYRLFVNPSDLQLNQILAAICSILMLIIMIPLFSTSFKFVRKKFKPTTWKKLQRLAYCFYGLIYIHILLLTLPNAIGGDFKYIVTVCAYSVIFVTYAVIRIKKAEKNKMLASSALLSGVAIAVIVAFLNPVIKLPEQTTLQQIKKPEIKIADTKTEQQENKQESENINQEPINQTDEQITAQEPQSTQANTNNTQEVQTPTNQLQVTEPITKPSSEPTIPEQPNITQVEPKAANAPVETQSEPAQPEPEPVYQYKNGTFSGTSDGFKGAISVNVKIQNDIITDISLASSSDDEPYISFAQAVIPNIISAQSTNVDTVSGATFSSRGIINAVKNALSSAKN